MTMQATVRSIQGGSLTKASNQWRERPADERFETIHAMRAACYEHKMRCAERKTNTSALVIDTVGEEIVVRGNAGTPAHLTHWAFGQLAQRAGAPSDYIRKLPPQLAAQCLTAGLTRTEHREVNTLVRVGSTETNTPHRVHAFTGGTYRRVWNYEVADTLRDLRERQPSWQFPEPFRTAGGYKSETWGMFAAGKQVPVAFASDRDMFAFLVDYEHPVEIDGNALARGFFVENSEVGDAALKITMFLFDFVCSNIMVWGAKNVMEISMRHVGSVRDKFLSRNSQVLAALAAYGDTPASAQVETIRNAQRMSLGKDADEVLKTLFGRKSLGLTKTDIQAAQVVARETPRYGNPNSVWALVQGLTEVSQRTQHMDKRVQLDRAAGEVLNFAF